MTASEKGEARNRQGNRGDGDLRERKAVSALLLPRFIALLINHGGLMKLFLPRVSLVALVCRVGINPAGREWKWIILCKLIVA